MILRAKYVMPSSHEVFENGAVRVADSEIVEVGTLSSVSMGGGDAVIDLGDVALLPGFINAHAHLELGHLRGKLPPPPSFTTWLGDVVRLRDDDPERVEQTVIDGADEALRGGTTSIVDVTNTGHAVPALKKTPIRKRVHLETLGFSESRTESALTTLNNRLDLALQDDLLTVGVSPHAPYSTSERLYRESIRLARARGLPLCSHVAESVEEEEFIRFGTGPFADLLDSLNVSMDGWEPPGITPVQYLNKLGFFESAPLLIHGNYIRDDDVAILRDMNVTVVYCPRSHEYFGHPDHPFEKLFALGINIAIGTDSLASCPDLNMLNELKFAARRYPHVSPERILTLAMLNGAKPLKVRARVGGLRAGWKADMTAVALPSGGRRVTERILDDAARVVFTMVDGEICYRADS